MSFQFANLDGTTRRFMLQELEHDLAQDTLYLSPRLSPEGRARYPGLLAEALRDHDEGWLAEQLRRRDDLNPYEERHTTEGDLAMARVPANAAEVLAGDDFNRFYMRGLCARALAEGIDAVEVYRGRDSAQPRPESQALIGQRLSPAELLEDLRAWPRPPALGIPTGFNSGLTLRLPAHP